MRFAKSSIKCITRGDGDGAGRRDGVCLIYFDAERGRRRTVAAPSSYFSPFQRRAIAMSFDR